MSLPFQIRIKEFEGLSAKLYAFKFVISKLWGIEFNALDKSMITVPAKNALPTFSFLSTISLKIMWFELYLLQ